MEKGGKAMDENQDIRKLIAKRRLRQYEVAQVLGVSEFTLSRWLHNKLEPERKEKILKAIDKATERIDM